MNVYRGRILCCLFVIFFGVFFGLKVNIYGQTTSSEDASKVLMDIVKKTEKAMVRGNQNIKSENFHLAKESSVEILKNLMILEEIFMPVKKRIEKILQIEQSILRRTFNEEKKQTSNPIQNQLSFDQSNNSKKTQICIEILQQQLKSNPKEPTVSQKSNVEKEKQLKTVEEIQGLLKKAKVSQDNALNNLQSTAYKQAINDEKRAIEYLEKALKLFNKKKKGQQKKNNQNQSSNKQKSDQKKSNPQNKESKSSQQKKMTPKEALKQLSKLRKEANDEKKRREKKYGKVAIPQSVPVEKDW